MARAPIPIVALLFLISLVSCLSNDRADRPLAQADPPSEVPVSPTAALPADVAAEKVSVGGEAQAEATAETEAEDLQAGAASRTAVRSAAGSTSTESEAGNEAKAAVETPAAAAFASPGNVVSSSDGLSDIDVTDALPPAVARETTATAGATEPTQPTATPESDHTATATRPTATTESDHTAAATTPAATAGAARPTATAGATEPTQPTATPESDHTATAAMPAATPESDHTAVPESADTAAATTPVESAGSAVRPPEPDDASESPREPEEEDARARTAATGPVDPGGIAEPGEVTAAAAAAASREPASPPSSRGPASSDASGVELRLSETTPGTEAAAGSKSARTDEQTVYDASELAPTPNGDSPDGEESREAASGEETADAPVDESATGAKANEEVSTAAGSDAVPEPDGWAHGDSGGEASGETGGKADETADKPAGEETGEPSRLAAATETQTESAKKTSESSTTEPAPAEPTGSTAEPGPAESTAERAAAEPAPEPAGGRPEPLSVVEIARRLRQMMPAGISLIGQGNAPLAIYHDFDSDGYDEVFVPAVERATDSGLIDAREITNQTRLYSPETDVFVFRLYAFFQRCADLVLWSDELLGAYRVLESFELVRIVAGRPDPVAVVVTFMTLQGSASEWVVFSESAISRLSLRKRIGSRPAVGDIDGDGVIDIVLSNESFEPGIGYETYLSWLKWTGTSFELHDSANVVRSLREFLDDAIEEIEQGRLASFLLRVGSDPEDTPTDASDTALRDEVFGAVFHLAPSPAHFTNRPLPPDARITRIVYSQIFENPFTGIDSDGRSVSRDDFFPLTVRVETDAGSVHLYTARVFMASNPFRSRRFFFGRYGRR